MDLGIPFGALHATARDIDERGDVVGTASAGSTAHAFLWSARDGMRDLTPGLADQSHAWGINEAGAVVGNLGNPAFVADDPTPVVWTEREGAVELALVPGWLGANARAVNERGVAVGNLLDGGGALRGFVWTEGGGTVELNPPGSASNMASDVNDRGLPRLSSGPAGARGINNAGDIVGDAVGSDGRTHPVLWRVRGSR